MATTKDLTSKPWQDPQSHDPKVQLERIKAKLAAKRANNPTQHLRKAVMECLQDVRERLDHIKERREQKALEKEERNSAFASALAARNRVKETEKSTAAGQKRHRLRIEEWRDGVNEECRILETAAQRKDTKKRGNEDALTTTSSSKRRKVAAAKEAPPPTSKTKAADAPPPTKNSVPWLRTRASMADEDVFTDKPGDRYPDLRNTDQILPSDGVGARDDESADEEYGYEDGGSEDSYLTELEQLVLVQVAMVGAVQCIVPAMVKHMEGKWEGFEDGDGDFD